ncbi:hypothetical protein [Phenylobacterium sp.]|uniref:hypothetical protein n=1 Tax=Phenylobacterium sp. TaxID=1871053 RepID=UPI002F40F953
MNHKMLLGGVLGAAAMSLSGCHLPAKRPVDTAKIADAVKADADSLVADLNARDAVKTVAHNAPDSVIMLHGGPNIGPVVDLALTKQMVTDPALKMTLHNEIVDVAASGEMAVFGRPTQLPPPIRRRRSR